MTVTAKQELENVDTAIKTLEERVRELEANAKRLADALHERRAHPDYEYETTKCGRKQYRPKDDCPGGEGWEPNGEGHDAWERFDYHEEHYWRRLRVADTHRGNEEKKP